MANKSKNTVKNSAVELAPSEKAFVKAVKNYNENPDPKNYTIVDERCIPNVPKKD